MKPKLITLTVTCATMLAAISIAHAQDPATKDLNANKPHSRWGNGLERMTETLDLTPEQQAKIRPILEQAKPQIAAIRQESRQKIKAIRDNVRSQIRPFLTASQQQKLDAIHKAREDMRKARQEMHEVAKQYP
jgi:Spy/CpxP family protein refolding chaperone